LALLAALQVRRGLAMLFVSHDLAVAEGVAQRLAVMQHGTSLEARLTAKIFAAPCRWPYSPPTVTADARV
jgi:ABC-type microcin C transport system duplicated ATPase subunit YejF